MKCSQALIGAETPLPSSEAVPMSRLLSRRNSCQLHRRQARAGHHGREGGAAQVPCPAPPYCIGSAPVDGVQADHLAGQVEAEHLFTPQLVVDVGSPCRAHGVDGAERIVGAEQVSPPAEGPHVLHRAVQPVQRDLSTLYFLYTAPKAQVAEADRTAVVGDRAGAGQFARAHGLLIVVSPPHPRGGQIVRE